MALNHVLQSIVLDDETPRLQQILDIHIAHIKSASPIRHQVNRFKEVISARARDEGTPPSLAPPLVGIEDLLHPFRAKPGLELSATLAHRAGLEQRVEFLGERQLHAVLADDELATAVAVRHRWAPGEAVHFPGASGAEGAGLRAEGLAAALEHGRLLAAEARAARALLRTDLLVGAADVVARLGGGGALARVVALVDDGEVQDVAAQGQVEVFRGPGF